MGQAITERFSYTPLLLDDKFHFMMNINDLNFRCIFDALEKIVRIIRYHC